MGSWRDVAAAVFSGEQSTQPAVPTPAENDLIPRLGGRADLAANLAALERMSVPRRINDRARWAETVGDAVMLARWGWAKQALDLGWSVADLYGIDPVDSYEFSGLAVWLRGGELVLLDANSAIAKASESRTRYFTRGGWGHGWNAPRPPVMLWEFGR